MADNEKQSGGHLDKIVMGVILGGAIGSVLGLTLAPRKGKETRKMIKEKGGEILNKGKEVVGDAAQKIIRDHKETFESTKYQMKKGKGFLRWLFGKKKTREQMPKATIDSEENE
ncbi:YtxH domain-containing protein [Candidatus Peregrinibacteria bacterium]|nr:YtxH domain-containing protein [Candidatus Peregrinibacteria bacterium]